MLTRPRRNRKNQALRNLVRENNLTPHDLIMPLFVTEADGTKDPIASLPGQFRLGPDLLIEKAKELYRLGIQCISLFPVVNERDKDLMATVSRDPQHFYQTLIKELKQVLPDLLIMTDVAMDPYSTTGHDGVVDSETGEILNDETNEILAQMALTQAESGSDILGPSDMMDGRVGHIRRTLDDNNYKNVSIMSYAVKYCSAFYGPFREALDSAPKLGDKKTYQMDPSNSREAIREARLDESEGADILMVKPGLPYLDVVYRLAQITSLPLAVYHVSGEYAMLKAAQERGWIDGEQCLFEALLGFKRAGANMILSYGAEEVAGLISSQ